MAAAQRLAQPELPRRFYKAAEAGPHDGGFAVLLDGKVARTPARKPLAVADRRIAEALAAEWEAQGERIDPAAMPLTRIVNAAIDRVAGEMAAVRADIVKYAGSDLVCYRAEGPQSLVDGAGRGVGSAARLGARGARRAFRARRRHRPCRRRTRPRSPRSTRRWSRSIRSGLAALHTVTTLTGSAVIALALAPRPPDGRRGMGRRPCRRGLADEPLGQGRGALARRALRRREMDAAALILAQ